MQYRLYRLVRLWSRSVYEGDILQRRLNWLKRSLLLVNALFLLQFVVRGTEWYQEPFLQVFLLYPMGLFFAFVVLSSLLVTCADVIRLLFFAGDRMFRWVLRSSPAGKQTPELKPVDPSRRRFLKLGGLSAAAAAGAIPVVASLATARDYVINRLDLHFENFPAALDGLTIAHVSDIHSGIFMSEQNMREIFELVNSLRPQLIMVTGDFVDTSDAQIESIYKATEMLKADHGLFGCLGNHDHFATASKVSAAMEQRGMFMLNNGHQKLILENRELTIVGIDDAGRGRANFARLDQAVENVCPESFKIMLTHRPDMWDTVRSYGADLTLAGHTHGGQVGFRLGPLNLNPVYLVHKYAMGHFEAEGKHLYVNVGVGMVGVPIRMVKPEVALLTLHSA